MTPTALADAVAALRGVPRVGLETVPDADILSMIDLAGEARQLADVHLALASGELARRSSIEAGSTGLASRAGARTPEELVKRSTGLSGRDVAVAVRVGRLTAADGVLGGRVCDGSVTVQAAEAIRAGLDGAAAPLELLEAATQLLCDEAASVDVDRLQKRAREVRDELDETGVADREAVLRGRRSIRRIDLRDGMKRLVWDYDPETAGVVDAVYDRATSPRRGGPRFVDTEMVQRVRELERDPRTTEQLASDAFAELLRQAAGLDPAVLVGRGAPAVRVLVSATSLASGSGFGVIEGSNEAVSLATVQRLVCTNGSQTALIDSIGNVLDLGREQRLYSARQRVALAIRDGGCLWPGCDRPPSWCEAHHIDHWARDHGRTDLDRGVLLCRHHHLRLHNDGWQIERRAGRLWLEPPPGATASGALLETKSRAMREHLAREGLAREGLAREGLAREHPGGGHPPGPHSPGSHSPGSHSPGPHSPGSHRVPAGWSRSALPAGSEHPSPMIGA